MSTIKPNLDGELIDFGSNDLSGVGAVMSDQGVRREIYSPLTAGEFPTDPDLLREGAEICAEFAETRADVGDDQEAGFYLHVAGLMMQYASLTKDSR